MALVPTLDLRPAHNDVEIPHAPANVESEQALLGALLYDNAAFERIPDHFRPDHFFEPFHQRLFNEIALHIGHGQLAEPILMAEKFIRDPGYEQLGGIRYLADLVDRAPPGANVGDYARVIYDLALRRMLLQISGDIAADALATDEDRTAREVVESAEAALYSLAETGQAQGGLSAFSDYLTGAIGMAAEAFQRDGGLSGLSTGLTDLDAKLGGLHPSDLVIIAARPAMGKTSLACNIAFHVARHYAYEARPDGERKTTSGGRVAFFSLEMSGEQLALRILSEAAGVSGDSIRKGEINAMDFGRLRDASTEINAIPLFTDATGGLSLGKLAARARRMKRQHGLDLIVIDYLQLMTGNKRYSGGERVQEVTEITTGLKALAKELNVPVIALSQLSRQVENREDKRPQLADLRESGSIEQDADMVMFIYREEYYLSRAEPKAGSNEHAAWLTDMDACAGKADIIIGKQRHGPIGTVQVSFNADLTKFGNLAREHQFSARTPYGDN